MTFQYNGNTYTVDADSTYKDIIIPVSSFEQACTIATAVNGVTKYVFNVDSYENMVVKKTMIIHENGIITVRIILREQTDLEKAHSEIKEIRDAIAEISDEISDKSAEEHPILFPNIYDVDEVIPGQRYVVNGQVVVIDEVIEEPIEDWVQKKAMKGK